MHLQCVAACFQCHETRADGNSSYWIERITFKGHGTARGLVSSLVEGRVSSINRIVGSCGGLLRRAGCVRIQVTWRICLGDLPPCQWEPTDKAALPRIQGTHISLRTPSSFAKEILTYEQGACRIDQN